MRHSRNGILWAILIGFLASYLLFFVVPVFLHESQKMMFFRYIPTLPRRGMIGVDAQAMRLFVLAWLQGQDPYIVPEISMGVFYPPVALLLFSPLGFVSAHGAYIIILALTLVCYVGLALLLPVAFGKRLTPLVLLLFLSGLFSYGLQFELERGQYNVIAVFLSMLGIYLFHRRPESRAIRFVSYTLLTTAIQLKLYPAIFCLGLVRDWSRWRENLKRLAMLGAANVLLLFGMGQNLFRGFASSIGVYGSDVRGEKVNHSAASFAAYLSSQIGTESGGGTLPSASFFTPGPRLLEAAFLALVVLLIGLCILIAIRRRLPGSAPQLLLASALGALTIPFRSFDYTLAFLPAPMAIFFQQISDNDTTDSGLQGGKFRQSVRFLAVAVMSVAYFSTLFSYTNKPDVFFLVNNFPALLVVLLLTPLLSVL